MPPASRLKDKHKSPKEAPAPPPVPIPHVGGPIVGPGEPSVLIGGLPAASVGDMLLSVGPPDSIVAGSNSVMINAIPAARMGDQTPNAGEIVEGEFNVQIGG